MTDALETAISSLSTPNISLPAALRGLLVVSRRIGSDELTRWLRYELTGYDKQDEGADGNAPDLPSYRSRGWPIRLGFDGPMQSLDSLTLAPGDLPAKLAEYSAAAGGLWQPIAELEALAESSDDPQLQLPPGWIALCREAIGRGEVPHPAMFILNRAAIVIPRTHLRGVLDQIRTTALDLALGIEEVAPEAGETGGPTIENDQLLSKEVHFHMMNIYSNGGAVTVGDNATVSTGSDATISTGADATIASGEGATAVRVEAGDLDGLLQAARAFIGEEGVVELSKAIEADGGTPAAATTSFLERVKSGAYVMASGITTNAAYAGLVELVQAFAGMAG